MIRMSKKILSGLLALLLVLTAVVPGSVQAKADETQEKTNLFEGNGLYINCFDYSDFPVNNPFVSLQPEEQLARILDFAEKYGYSTIYFEALDYSNAMYRSSLVPLSPDVRDENGEIMLENPLKTVAELCSERGLALVAVVDPFKIGEEGRLLNEDRIFSTRNEEYAVTTVDGVVYYNILNENVREYIKRIVEELVKRYDIDGVLLEMIDMSSVTTDSLGIGATDMVTQLLDEISKLIRNEGKQQKLIVEIDGGYTDTVQTSVKEQWITAGLMDAIVFDSPFSVSDDADNYEKDLIYWKTFAEMANVDFNVRISAEKIKLPDSGHQPTADGDELFFRRYVNEKNGIENYICSGYTSLSSNGEYLAVQMTYYDSMVYPDLTGELTISKKLAVTRPYENITWTGKKYFIMGTSDPTVPLYYNGEEVQRISESGIFGILVDVKEGKNEYVFSQNQQVAYTTIERPDPDSTAVKIKTIRESSVFPQVSRGIRAGETIKLECIAPSNGDVTATINGERVQLKQVAATAEAGIPAWYSAEYTIPAEGYPARRVTNVGNIVYRVRFNGSTTTVNSPGELMVVGKNADFVVRAVDYHTNVYHDTDVTNEFLTTLRRGAMDYVVNCTDDGYYELASGGYVPVKSVEVVSDNSSPENTVSGYTIEYDERAEIITLTGTAGVPYHTELADGKLIITLFNTQGIDKIEAVSSELVEKIDVDTDTENSITKITLNLKEDAPLWGYAVEYAVENLSTLETEAAELDVSKTMIYLSKAPKFSTNKLKPLDGLVVVLDAGHGGTDPGALGFGGAEGATEAILNYATAKFLEARLKQLGAKVMMLPQPSDGKLVLEERVAYAADIKPDLFISLHHNSTAETTDSNEVSGTAVYYHFDASQSLARHIASFVSGSLQRENDGAMEGYFYVTRMTAQPSVLVELAYMVNPLEYEQCCNVVTLYKTAYAISDAVMATIRSFE